MAVERSDLEILKDELHMLKKRNGHSSGNGHQMRALLREGRSASKALQAQIDKAVALADREIGLHPSAFSLRTSPATNQPPATPAVDRLPLTPSPMTTPGGLPVAPVNSVPSQPAPEPISAAAYTERIRAGWVPVMGLPGTPITSGFIRELGEYNPKLEGINGIWTYQEMRRGDGQVAGTLRACKLPIMSARWEVVPGDVTKLKLETRNRKTVQFPISSFQFPIPARGSRPRRRPRKCANSFATIFSTGWNGRIIAARGTRRPGKTWCAARCACRISARPATKK